MDFTLGDKWLDAFEPRADRWLDAFEPDLDRSLSGLQASHAPTRGDTLPSEATLPGEASRDEPGTPKAFDGALCS